MPFSSIEFIFFFIPIVWGITYIFRNCGNHIKLIVIISSLIFYFWGEGKYLLLIITQIFFTYLIIYYINNKVNNIRTKQLLLLIAIVGNLIPLFVFKYKFLIIFLYTYGFDDFANYQGNKNEHLPLGVSFFVFQLISYSVDSYKLKNSDKSNNLINIFMYIIMFPHQLAGPIVRFYDILSYLKKPSFTKINFVVGFNLFTIGLAQKVLIADYFAEIADPIFLSNIAELTSIQSWFGAIAYTIQIFFDFQGYSLMAAGLAIQFGIIFPRNFNYPYTSRSITEFWQRWHISLSSWFRDYVYIPLGGNRKGIFSNCINLFIVFLLCGLWHGANFTFIIWGIYHGIFLIIEKSNIFKTIKNSRLKFICHLYVLLIVLVGWVIFRSPNIQYAKDYIFLMFSFNNLLSDIYINFNLNSFIVTIIAIYISCGFGYKHFVKFVKFPESNSDIVNIYNDSSALSNIITHLIFITLTVFIAVDKFSPFIYFRF
jgi:alginate O-acetyltransferase complex protein AlgI